MPVCEIAVAHECIDFKENNKTTPSVKRGSVWVCWCCVADAVFVVCVAVFSVFAAGDSDSSNERGVWAMYRAEWLTTPSIFLTEQYLCASSVDSGSC